MKLLNLPFPVAAAVISSMSPVADSIFEATTPVMDLIPIRLVSCIPCGSGSGCGSARLCCLRLGAVGTSATSTGCVWTLIALVLAAF